MEGIGKKIMHKATISALLLLGHLVFIDAAAGDTYLVKPDGTGDYPVIQAAMDAANNGDEVLLADGVFKGMGNKEVLFWGKAITVRSESGNPLDCIINAEGEIGLPYNAFSFDNDEGPDSVVKDITILNGSTSTVC